MKAIKSAAASLAKTQPSSVPASAPTSILAAHDCISFEGHRKIASGPILDVARKTKPIFDRGERAPVLIFDAVTSRPVEIDFRGSLAAVLKRIKASAPPETAGTSSAQNESESDSDSRPESESAPRGPGRPKLGVVAREVTLLPRHWDWLGAQPRGASVALRRLVEQARRQNRAADQKREAQESAYRFMSALAGNLPGYEEALRALFASDLAALQTTVEAWPKDVREHAFELAGRAAG
jgi:hypothetical protein